MLNAECIKSTPMTCFKVYLQVKTAQIAQNYILAKLSFNPVWVGKSFMDQP